MGGAHNEALRRLGIPIAGMLGIDADESQRFTRRMGIPKAYTSIQEVAEDKDVNVVHLCTPNFMHFPHAKILIEAGKHVICEKPLANSSKEALQLVELAKKKKAVGAVNYSIRYYPMNQEAHARIQAGKLGAPRILHAEYCQDWLFLPTDWNWRLTPEEGGDLRAVGDIGTHVMDMLCWLTGLEIAEVMADLSTMIPVRKRPKKAVETFSGKLAQNTDYEEVQVRTEDYAGILLRFNNGARGVITLSQISAGRKNAFWWQIDGSQESYLWHQEEPNQLWIGHREQSNEVLMKDPALMLLDVRRYAAYPGGHAEGYPDSFARHFGDVYAYIEQGDFSKPPTFPTFEDGRRELVLCEAILESARGQCWVKIQY